MSEVVPPAERLGTVLHDGHVLAYSDTGPVDAPAVLLIHGMVSDGTTWARAAAGLAELGHRVIVPDLLGSGRSDKPAGRFELADFAASVATVVRTLDAAPVTVVGHSFGGAVAMQLAHGHPDLVRRLVLVSAGGLGRRVHPILRAATLPGAPGLVRLVVNQRTAAVYRAPRLHRTLRLSPDVVEMLSRAGRGLASTDSRAAFFQTLRMAINQSGQRGSLLETEHVALDLPTLIVWSQGDPVVPVAHAHDTHAHLADSRLEIFPGTTHQPHHHSAARFVDTVHNFLATT